MPSPVSPLSTDIAARADRGTRASRRRELVAAATSVIASNGLAGTTLAKVAAAAGLSPGIVNHHFDTKDALLHDTLRALSEEFSQGLERAIATNRNDPAAGLSAIVALTFDENVSDWRKVAVWYAFQSEAHWRDSYMSVCGERDRAYVAAIRDLMALLTAAMPLDADVMARSFAGLLESYWQDILFEGEAFDRAAARAASHRYLAAIFPAHFASAPAGKAASPVPHGAPSVVPFPAREGAGQTPAQEEGPAVTLPAWTYTSEEFFALEKREIFMKEWHLVCHVSQLKAPGDYRTFEMLGERAFVMRGKDGRVRGFHNVCRHRAHAVVTGQGGTCKGAITCPYHGWSYAFDGALKTVAQPHSFAQFEHRQFGLPEIDTEIFMGFVFIRFGGDGASLAERYAPYAREMAAYRFEDMVPVDELHMMETGADWKNVWDNYLEGYHFAMSHPGLTGLMNQAYDIEADSGRRVARLSHSLREKTGRDWSGRMYRKIMEPPAHLPASMAQNWTYFFMFPLLSFDVYPEMVGHFQLVPAGPGRSVLRYQNFALPETLADRRARAARWLNWRINGQVQNEDDSIVASVQSGLTSSSYTTGILSQKEVIVHNFQNWVREALPVARLERAPEPGAVARVNAEMKGH